MVMPTGNLSSLEKADVIPSQTAKAHALALDKIRAATETKLTDSVASRMFEAAHKVLAADVKQSLVVRLGLIKVVKPVEIAPELQPVVAEVVAPIVTVPKVGIQKTIEPGRVHSEPEP